jgi:uncharacterized damage-inducible protein DinB
MPNARAQRFQSIRSTPPNLLPNITSIPIVDMPALKTYDYLTRARARIFDHVRSLSPADYSREFPIGLGTLGRTLTHVMICEWMYAERIAGRDVPPYAEWPIQDETPPPFAVLESEWTNQATRTRATLSEIQDWTAELEYRTVPDQNASDVGPPQIVTATYDDLFTQLAFHEIHHRAQVMNILRHLGITIDDVDYNTLMYHTRPAP